jgi:hypothetical protein
MPKTFQVSVDIVVEAGDSESAKGYISDLLENALAPHVHRIPASYVHPRTVELDEDDAKGDYLGHGCDNPNCCGPNRYGINGDDEMGKSRGCPTEMG